VVAVSRPGDPYDLQRFVEAQEPVYHEVLAELRDGRKRSHWMWFVFPQISGLGASTMSRRFAISSIAEAEAYLNHPVLGHRLRECTTLVMQTADRTVEAIFGHVDSLKFRSSLTLFAHVTKADDLFAKALEKFFGGEPDEMTLRQL
jgi:uncharacterized protein (DUF1810 family)